MGPVSSVFGKKTPTKILILGLDSSGKTSILNGMKMGLPFLKLPTIGYNREDIIYKSKHYQIWDVGGQYELRQYWKCYYVFTNGLIVVVDAADKDRIKEAKQELEKAINHPDLAKVPILIYANKQDLPDAMKKEELVKKLGLEKLRNRLWHIEPACATSGLGIMEGLKWLAKSM